MRQRAIEIVSVRLMNGAPWKDATQGLPGAVQDWVDTLHDEGDLRDWRAFRRACYRAAHLPVPQAESMGQVFEAVACPWCADLLARMERDLKLNAKAMGAPEQRAYLERLIRSASDAEEAAVLYKGAKGKMLVGRWRPTNDARQQGTGRYAHSRMLRLCRTCGHPVAVHTAETTEGDRPCLHNDYTRAESASCACEEFRPTSRFMAPAEFARTYWIDIKEDT